MKEYIVSVDDDDMDYEEVFISYIKRQEELIRCKDCVMYEEGKRVDGHWCRGRKVKANSYCDMAERKEK